MTRRTGSRSDHRLEVQVIHLTDRGTKAEMDMAAAADGISLGRWIRRAVRRHLDEPPGGEEAE